MSFTKVQAINICLKGIGIAPIATEDDPDTDAGIAWQTIEQVSSEIQSRGWWFNREGNWKLTPDPITGYISVPGSARSIIPSGGSRGAGLTIRGTKIYDLYNHTYDLRDRAIEQDGILTIEFIFVTELDYSDLPPVAQIAIAYSARRVFAQDLEVDKQRWDFQKNDERDAHINLMREETKNKKRNTLRDNSTIAAFLANVGGRNAQSTAYSFGYPKRDDI